jgi:hypothetical protein
MKDASAGDWGGQLGAGNWARRIANQRAIWLSHGSFGSELLS